MGLARKTHDDTRWRTLTHDDLVAVDGARSEEGEDADPEAEHLEREMTVCRIRASPLNHDTVTVEADPEAESHRHDDRAPRGLVVERRVVVDGRGARGERREDRRDVRACGV